MSCPPPDCGCPCTCPITVASTTVNTCSRPWPESWARLQRLSPTPPSTLMERAQRARLMTITIMMSSLSSSTRRWSSALISSSRIQATRRCGATGESDLAESSKPVTDLQVLLCWWKSCNQSTSDCASTGLSVNTVTLFARSLSLALSWSGLMCLCLGVIKWWMVLCCRVVAYWGRGKQFSSSFSFSLLSLVPRGWGKEQLLGEWCLCIFSLCFPPKVCHGNRSISFTSLLLVWRYEKLFVLHLMPLNDKYYKTKCITKL